MLTDIELGKGGAEQRDWREKLPTNLPGHGKGSGPSKQNQDLELGQGGATHRKPE